MTDWKKIKGFEKFGYANPNARTIEIELSKAILELKQEIDKLKGFVKGND